MTVRFSALWCVWIGWMISDCLWGALGAGAPELKVDFAIAYFIGAVQIFERFRSKPTVTIG